MEQLKRMLHPFKHTERVGERERERTLTSLQPGRILLSCLHFAALDKKQKETVLQW